MKKKLIPLIALIAAMAAGGTLMMMKGSDAVTVADSEKASLLTADTVNASFQSVGGRVVSVFASEQQFVKSGEIIMCLDTTDIDLQIAQLQTSLKQQEVKIEQAKIQGVHPEDLEKQRLLTATAQEAFELARANYDRNKALLDSGVIAQAAMDTINNQFETAKNNLAQQNTATKRLQAQNLIDSQNYAYAIELLMVQKETLEVQLKALETQKERMVLKAPSDGKITRIVPKAGENITAGATAAIIQSNQLYYSLYVDETQVPDYKVNDTVSGTIVSLNKKIEGKVKTISAAPQYASMRMSRDKGQSDVSTYLIRVDVPSVPELLPGMTVEVNTDEGIS